jgi:hypothetical protein
MRCNASPTTSTAAPDPAAVARETSEQDRVVESFEAIVGAMLMKPVAEAMGPMGAFFGDAVARAALERSIGDDAA